MSGNVAVVIESDKEKKFNFLYWLKKKLMVMSGFLLILILISVVLVLATWDVYDPSYSYATSNPPKNFMGYGGAIFSDIIIQCFGLASVIALFPPAIWSLTLLSGNKVERFSKRFSAWIANFFISAAFLASCTPSPFWPIQNGFGGIIGDMIIRLPILFIESYPTAMGDFLFNMVLLCTTISLTFFASGTIGRRVEDEILYEIKDNLEITQRDQEEYIKGSLILGALEHVWYVLKARVFRVFGVRSLFSSSRKKDHNFDLYSHFNSDRIEPVLDESLSDIKDSDQASKVKQTERPQENSFQDVDAIFHSDSENINDMGEFSLPPKTLLSRPKSFVCGTKLSPDVMRRNACILGGVLGDFGIQGEIINIRPGPVVTLYELEPAPGIKSSRIIGLADDISRSMSAVSARVAVIPGRNAIGIELPNDVRETVLLRDLIFSDVFQGNKSALAIALGKNIEGEPIVADLAKMPHLLIAGTTGSGKSVAINTMILSLLYRMTPDKCHLIMIDPKMLELSVYDGIPHLLTPVVTDPKKAVTTLKWLVGEMEERYRKMSKVGVRNIDGFNMKIAQSCNAGKSINRTVQTGFDRKTGEAIYETEQLDLRHMPYIVVVIDEMADLMMVARKDIEGAVQRLAQMARAAGIHVIMATQRPSVDVITGTIKANFPTRISFQV
ncbi:DNA translocase FtsK, partial [Candidatus Liberibacter sp.]|uniref:FtsK/SpoIIIE family DNA translocase n=1 Tax=Candidatus Liberibacter sp. TaxID=34022 RepID=UPI0021751C57